LSHSTEKSVTTADRGRSHFPASSRSRDQKRPKAGKLSSVSVRTRVFPHGQCRYTMVKGLPMTSAQSSNTCPFGLVAQRYSENLRKLFAQTRQVLGKRLVVSPASSNSAKSLRISRKRGAAATSCSVSGARPHGSFSPRPCPDSPDSVLPLSETDPCGSTVGFELYTKILTTCAVLRIRSRPDCPSTSLFYSCGTEAPRDFSAERSPCSWRPPRTFSQPAPASPNAGRAVARGLGMAGSERHVPGHELNS
jgi:hypothetical protein